MGGICTGGFWYRRYRSIGPSAYFVGPCRHPLTVRTGGLFHSCTSNSNRESFLQISRALHGIEETRMLDWWLKRENSKAYLVEVVRPDFCIAVFEKIRKLLVLFFDRPSSRGKREIVQRVLKKLPLAEVNEARKFCGEKDGLQIQFC